MCSVTTLATPALPASGSLSQRPLYPSSWVTRSFSLGRAVSAVAVSFTSVRDWVAIVKTLPRSAPSLVASGRAAMASLAAGAFSVTIGRACLKPPDPAFAAGAGPLLDGGGVAAAGEGAGGSAGAVTNQ